MKLGPNFERIKHNSHHRPNIAKSMAQKDYKSCKDH